MSPKTFGDLPADYMRLTTLIWIFGCVLATGIAASWMANQIVAAKSAKYTFSDIDRLPPQKTGLLLGTSKILKDGRENLYFNYRMQAAAELYHHGKIKNLVVSGDNSTPDYNEPQDMKDALIALGVPDSVIYLDYAGLRTFDSVIRAKEVFGQSSFTIISQKFHNERAIYIARINDIDAYGYDAKDVDRYNGFKTRLREFLARDKLFLDQLINIRPKHTGEPVNIP